MNSNVVALGQSSLRASLVGGVRQSKMFDSALVHQTAEQEDSEVNQVGRNVVRNQFMTSSHVNLGQISQYNTN